MLADALYRRADWQWAQNRGAPVTHGWKSESGFLEYCWGGCEEGALLLLYILGLGSPTHPLPVTDDWGSIHGRSEGLATGLLCAASSGGRVKNGAKSEPNPAFARALTQCTGKVDL